MTAFWGYKEQGYSSPSSRVTCSDLSSSKTWQNLPYCRCNSDTSHVLVVIRTKFFQTCRCKLKKKIKNKKSSCVKCAVFDVRSGFKEPVSLFSMTFISIWIYWGCFIDSVDSSEFSKYLIYLADLYSQKLEYSIFEEYL